MTRYSTTDTYELIATLVAELQAISDYQPEPAIAAAQAQVIRRIAQRFQIDTKDLFAEFRRQGGMADENKLPTLR